MMQYEISKTSEFARWLDKVKDSQFRINLNKRLKRVLQGYLGDYKQLDADLYELRFFIGPGYRVYFVLQDGVLLLIGGTKRTQNSDIKKARKIFINYLED